MAGNASGISRGGTGQTTAPGARIALGLEIGVDVQAHDTGLDALAAFNTNGFVVQTANNTFVGRSLTAPAAGITITNPAGTVGNPIFALANDLSALEGLSSTGIAVRTAADTWVVRTLQAPAAGITITNPAGIAGDPTLVLANDLAALEAMSGTGIAVHTGVSTWVERTLIAPAAGITITDGAGIAGNPTLVLANDLLGVEGLAANGMVARTATDTWTVRTLAGTANEITATNGDGIAGAPTFSLPAALTFTGKTVTGGTFTSPTIDGAPSSKFFKGLLHGLTLSNNVTDGINDIDIAIGTAASNATTPVLIDLTSALTKQLDVVWAVGTNAGMLATGAAIANTTYHIFVIRRPDTGVIDIAADTSVTGVNIATNTNVNYTQIRRIGSILRETATIVAFRQYGDVFKRNGIGLIDRNSSVAAANILLVLSVPLGIKVQPLMSARVAGLAGDVAVVRMGDGDDTISQIDVADINSTAADGAVEARSFVSGFMTNTSAQIRYTLTNTTGTPNANTVTTMGWIDYRDRT